MTHGRRCAVRLGNRAWVDQAACRDEDPEMFFRVDGERPESWHARLAEAKDVCMVCEVRATCLEDALAKPEKHGVFGGLDEEERKLELKRRARLAAA